MTAGKVLVQSVVIDEDSVGQRIDNFLLSHLKGVPKSRIYRMLRNGEVRVNSARADPATRLAEGDRLRIPPVRQGPTRATGAPVAGGPPFVVVFEDAALLVIDKPAGVAVHGGSGISSGVIERLRAQRPEQRFLELVHRLDRDTSGLLMVAKKRSALVALHDQLRQGRMEKVYCVLARGDFGNRARTVRLPLFKYLTPEGERRVAIRSEGKPAETRFTPLQRVGADTLLEARLMTGRTHQIRAHLAHIGHPIAGDDKYGDFAWNRELTATGLKRMFLHAARLRLPHPLDGLEMAWEAPLPPALADYLSRQGVISTP